jgi:hypothetical protein
LPSASTSRSMSVVDVEKESDAGKIYEHITRPWHIKAHKAISHVTPTEIWRAPKSRIQQMSNQPSTAVRRPPSPIPHFLFHTKHSDSLLAISPSASFPPPSFPATQRGTVISHEGVDLFSCSRFQAYTVCHDGCRN